MVTTQCHWARLLIRTFCPVIIFLFSFGQAVSADENGSLRVETDVFADQDDVPIAHSLTLFSSEVAWDFLDTTTTEKKKSESESNHSKAFNGEIVLHDPTRERVLLIDPLRQVKTSIDSIQLERLRVSLAKWVRTSDDKLLCWAGGPHFENGIQELDDAIELVGPRVQYRIETTDAPSPEIGRPIQTVCRHGTPVTCPSSSGWHSTFSSTGIKQTNCIRSQTSDICYSPNRFSR